MVRSRALLLSGLLALAAGCAAEPAVDAGAVVAAFRDCLYTYYEQRASGERPDRPLLERRARAGAALIGALERRGARVTEAEAREGLAGIAPRVERLLHTRTDLDFAEIEPPAPPPVPGAPRRANDFPGSYLVSEGVSREPERTAGEGGRAVRYHLITYDRALVLPYDQWLAARNRPDARFPGAVHRVERFVYIERGGIAEAEIARLADRAVLAAAGSPAGNEP
jgi:hypothetical protein